ncbi:MAG: hypothetical protein FJ206_01625 [Gemmatimonadetes bacterium]|nr:hypothetical protein [Gemmatimonadota bacterium]
MNEVLVALAVMGCGGTPMSQQVPVARDRLHPRAIDTLGAEAVVPVPPNQVWKILAAVYTDLGLEVNFREAGNFRLGSCYQRVRTRLGKERLSAFVDCGSTRSVPNADQYEVALTVLTTVRPNSSGTTSLFTFVLGVGLDNSGAASGRIWCYSQGALEERIRTGVEEKTRL